MPCLRAELIALKADDAEIAGVVLAAPVARQDMVAGRLAVGATREHLAVAAGAFAARRHRVPALEDAHAAQHLRRAR